jgi:hypothetical protein
MHALSLLEAPTFGMCGFGAAAGELRLAGDAARVMELETPMEVVGGEGAGCAPLLERLADSLRPFISAEDVYAGRVNGSGSGNGSMGRIADIGSSSSSSSSSSGGGGGDGGRVDMSIDGEEEKEQGGEKAEEEEMTLDAWSDQVGALLGVSADAIHRAQQTLIAHTLVHESVSYTAAAVVRFGGQAEATAKEKARFEAERRSRSRPRMSTLNE